MANIHGLKNELKKLEILKNYDLTKTLNLPSEIYENEISRFIKNKRWEIYFYEGKSIYFKITKFGDIWSFGKIGEPKICYFNSGNLSDVEKINYFTIEVVMKRIIKTKIREVENRINYYVKEGA